jgi:hypothetical protein
MQLRVFNKAVAKLVTRWLLPVSLLLTAATLSPTVLAQTGQAAELPDAPGFSRSNPDTALPAQDFSARASSNIAAPLLPSPLPEASRTQRHVQPGQAAPQLSADDKAWMGLRGVVSPFAGAGWLAAAGYEQLTNYSPNWGTDSGAFGDRLGTGAIRATSEGLLSNSVFAPLLHEDPRYYRLGRGHKPLARLAYAITRPLITRTDTGRPIPNLALMGGNLSGSVLTNAYYPQVNRGVTQTLATFGSSLAGSAIGDSIAEFFGGILFERHPHPSH